MHRKAPEVTLTHTKDAQPLQALIERSFLFYLQQALQRDDAKCPEVNDAAGR